MKTKRLHTTGKKAMEQQDVCGNCFAWVDKDNYCWDCGAEFEEESAYSIDDLLKKKD